ncbi:MAG: phosphonate metabolism protein/1,5-bisphosphokinase (PRPP-forming) PhnN, partial [Pseudomonadota bacterium]
MRGKLIFVVGPSGVGKDTLLNGARAALADDPRFHFVRRVVTRAEEAGGEDFESVDPEHFEALAAAGAFYVSWSAHGLRYGARAALKHELAAGRNVVLNGSRSVVADLAALEPNLDVIHIDAPEALVAQRLAARGRESAAEIEARRRRPKFAAPPGVKVAEICNDAEVEEGVARFLKAVLGAAHLPLTLQRAPIELAREPLCLIHRDSRIVEVAALTDAPMVELRGGDRAVSARLGLVSDPAVAAPEAAALSSIAFDRLGLAEGALVTVTRTPSPRSRAALRKKVGGGALTAPELERVVRDLMEGRCTPAETAGFLVAASTNLSFEEIVALTRLRAEMMEPLQWDYPLVVDKHSIGGAPGGRISLILTPIAVAHGLAMPKTSSRAITSAAGTADTMEAAARVDLDRAEMRRVMAEAGGCVLWNGRINHAPLDDVMQAITRPLGVSSRLLDVASILSKKLAAGATHAVMDIPVGPGAKVADEAEGQALADLFERVGAAVGLTVRAYTSAGGAPIGRGVGPALELRDVMAVLRGDGDAPGDLREK